MQNSTLDDLIKKAKNKKDWVYTIRKNIYYAVFNWKLVFYSEWDWPKYFWIYQLSYWFAVRVWEIENEWEIRKKMKTLLELYIL